MEVTPSGAPPRPRYTDADLDRAVATMLRAGVTLSALVVAGGGLWELRHPWRAVPDNTHFHAVEPALRSVQGIAAAAFHHAPGQARAIIQLGLVLLIATPVARVGLCVGGFARQRSWLYAGISTLVLGVLAWSLVSAFG